jgi:hypothetical protein
LHGLYLASRQPEASAASAVWPLYLNPAHDEDLKAHFRSV